MSDRGDDGADGADWLAAQFGESPEEEAPPARPRGERPPAAPPAVPPALVNPFGAPPAAPPPVPPAGAVPPPAAPPAPPPASAPPAPGFPWGLRPGGAEGPAGDPPPGPAAAPPVQPAPPVPPVPPAAPVAPPPFAGPPTEPYVPPASPDPEVPRYVELEPTQAFTPDFTQPDAAPPGPAVPPADPVAGPPEPLGPIASALSLLPTSPAAGPAAPEGAGAQEPGDALDLLFAEDRFQEVAPGPDPAEAPFSRRAVARAADGGGAEPPATGLGRTQKILLGVAGGLVGVLALIGLFLLGTRLPDLLGPAPAVVATPGPSPSSTAEPAGPVEPGVHAWDELLGGECLEPYEDAWATEFTVVDCSLPHTAQLVHRGSYLPEPEEIEGEDGEPVATQPPLPPFPGVEELQSGIDGLCRARGVVELDAVGTIRDAQMQGSFPVSAEQWEAAPYYACFLSRSSGEPLEGSAAVPPAGPED